MLLSAAAAAGFGDAAAAAAAETDELVEPQETALSLCLQHGNLRAARVVIDAQPLRSPRAVDALLVALLDADEIADARRLYGRAAAEGEKPLFGDIEPSVAERPKPPSAVAAAAAGGGPAVLDLRALPDGAAQVGLIEFLQRLSREIEDESQSADGGGPAAAGADGDGDGLLLVAGDGRAEKLRELCGRTHRWRSRRRGRRPS